MLLLFIKRLKEAYGCDEDGFFPSSSWQEETQLVPFVDEASAFEYIKKIKAEYRGKGRVKAGTITGEKTYTEGQQMHICETITTCLKSVESGRQVNVAYLSGGGEYPYSEDGLLSCELDDETKVL